MILQHLVEFAARIPDLPPAMYSPLAFKWQVELDMTGRYMGIVSLSGDEQKRRGLTLMSPNRKRSGTSPPPLLLADKAAYVLGTASSSPSESWHFKEFLNLTKECSDFSDEPAVKAVVAFLETHRDDPIEPPSDLEPGDLVCFRVGDIRPTDLPSVRRFWVAKNTSKGDSMQCIVCGRRGPVDTVSPTSIKGLPSKDGKATFELVCANIKVAWSYGAEQALIAPTCRGCGEAYANSINYMLRKDYHRVFVGFSAFIFWTAEENGFSPVTFLSQPQEEDVKRLIESYRTGNRSTLPSTEAFYSLSLSTSVSRVVIRDWLDTTVPKAQADLARWFQLQRLLESDCKPGRPFSLYALGVSIYLRKKQQAIAEVCWRDGKALPHSIAMDINQRMSPNVPRTLIRCALSGGKLPDWLLSQAIGRNRAEQGVTRTRAALIKAVLLSQLHNYKEDYMEKLDLTCTSPGYLCGRLLAELEAAQKAAINPKATIVDRYYGAASSAPATVFGNLLRGSHAHLSTLNRDKRGVFVRIDRNIQEILANLQEFPKTLNLKEQAMFALGYYHQKVARWAKSEDIENNNTEENK